MGEDSQLLHQERVMIFHVQHYFSTTICITSSLLRHQTSHHTGELHENKQNEDYVQNIKLSFFLETVFIDKPSSFI